MSEALRRPIRRNPRLGHAVGRTARRFTRRTYGLVVQDEIEAPSDLAGLRPRTRPAGDLLFPWQRKTGTGTDPADAGELL